MLANTESPLHPQSLYTFHSTPAEEGSRMQSILPRTDGSWSTPSPYCDITELIMSLTSWLPILCVQFPGQRNVTQPMNEADGREEESSKTGRNKDMTYGIVPVAESVCLTATTHDSTRANSSHESAEPNAVTSQKPSRSLTQSRNVLQCSTQGPSSSSLVAKVLSPHRFCGDLELVHVTAPGETVSFCSHLTGAR